MNNDRAAQIAATQDAIMKALKDTKRPTAADINQAKWAEQEKEKISAESVGVTPEDYRKWASGRPMPHVTEAVKSFMAKR